MNDIDLWEDIEILEKKGRQKEADSLMEIFRFRYIEYDEKKLQQAKKAHYKKFKYMPNV